MQPSRIQAVDHVNMEAPFGMDDALRWFYGELAGLEEVASVETRGGGLCFKSEQLELRIRFSTEPQIETVACRVTLAVETLEDVIDVLEERHIAFSRISGFTGSDRRLQTLDPAGNRVELKKLSPMAPL